MSSKVFPSANGRFDARLALRARPVVAPPHGETASPVKEGQVPADVVDKIRTARNERAALEEARMQSQLKALQERYLAQRSGLISADLDRKLKDYSIAHRLTEPARNDLAERSRSRAATMAYARELVVDLGAMTRLWDDTCRQFESIVAPPLSGEGEVIEAAGQQPIAQATVQTFFPPWHGSWDQGFWSSTTDPGSTAWTSQSYWEPGARVGSHLGFNRRPSDNDDGASIAHTSGMLVQFTMPWTAGLEVYVQLTRAFGKHFIDTDDEAGWSFCNVQVKESAVAEVYWDWNDWTADSHVERVLAQSGTFSSEKWVDKIPIAAGQSRGAFLHDPNIVFPAGQTIVVYAGTQEHVYAWVDDVSVRASANATWYVNAITVYVR